MKEVGLLQDTRLSVCLEPSCVNSRVHQVGFIEHWILNLPTSHPLQLVRWMCNVFDLMHSRNKLYYRVACVAVLLLCTASFNNTACMRRSGVGGRYLSLGRNLQADAITDVARQWKRPFVVVLSYRSHWVPNASAQICF